MAFILALVVLAFALVAVAFVVVAFVFKINKINYNSNSFRALISYNFQIDYI